MVGNRLLREVIANNQGLRTEYQYYEGTDRLYKEIHTGFAARLDSGNESYYAYADSTGGFYYKDSSGKVVGAVRAFFAGLPSKLSGWLFWTVSAFLVIAFFVPGLLSFLRKQESRLLRLWIPHQVRNDKTKHRLSFFHRGMCLLIAWIMFISPELFNQLSESAVQYSQIGRSSWGASGRTIIYEYDDNGSMAKKTTIYTSEPSNPIETVWYTYDIANRLIQTKTTKRDDSRLYYCEYGYNDDGIRIKSYSYEIDNGNIVSKKTTVYLIDSFNHTGYAQSLEELIFLKANPNLQTENPRSGRKYLIGDDVISQQSWVLSTISSPRYLLYDGHGSAALTTGGSTRQLAYYTGTDVAIADSYSYDGYGVLLQDESVASANPGKVFSTSISTNLLYAGEHFDTTSQQYYLRARWYNPLSGLFNRMDPYSGNTSDPQSLHKYLYCHANPVNGIDPSGEMSLAFALAVTGIIALTIAIMLPAIHGSWKQAKIITSRKEADSIFMSIFKGQITLSEWKEIASGFGRGFWTGGVNAFDTLSFRMIDPLNEYRNKLWQNQGLDESWVGSASNTFAWAGTASLYAAAAVWAWSAAGGGTMDIAISKSGSPYFIHIKYGVNGAWQHAVATGGFGNMSIIPTKVIGGTIISGIPVLYPEAVMDAQYAYTCVTAAISAFARGWGL